MSEIKVDNLTGKTTANDITVTVGATATAKLEQGLAKAWVAQLDGGAGANDSFNFASFTDNGDNNTATFTNNMSANYAITVAADEPQPTSIDRFVTVFARSASSFKMKTFTSSGGGSSVPQNATIHGDLA
jgi:hypothetical protein